MNVEYRHQLSISMRKIFYRSSVRAAGGQSGTNRVSRDAGEINTTDKGQQGTFE